MIRTIALLLLLLPSLAFGQTKAIIKGPTEVLASTLMVLSNEDAIGDNKVWIIPDNIKPTTATCGNSIFFTIPSPGTYSFGLIVADKNANIDYTFHKVLVKPNGTNPTDPIDPPPPPTTDFKELREASIKGLTTLQDPTTTTSLHSSLKSALEATKNASQPETIKAVQTTIGLVMGNRSNESYRTKNWTDLWRRPVETELLKLPPEKYRQGVEVLVETLKR